MAKPPEWLNSVPQTPLEAALRGRVYEHDALCSGDRRFPRGTAGKGCSCFGRMFGRKNLKKEKS